VVTTVSDVIKPNFIKNGDVFVWRGGGGLGIDETGCEEGDEKKKNKNGCCFHFCFKFSGYGLKFLLVGHGLW